MFNCPCQVNVPTIAAVMNTKPHNVTCRISSFRKKYGLNISCTSSGAGVRAKSANTGIAAAGGVISGRVTKATSGAAGKKKAAVGKRKADAMEEAVASGNGEEGEEEDQNGGEGGKDWQGNGNGKKRKARAVDMSEAADSDAEGEPSGMVKQEKTEDCEE
jgi:hypothetical protein